MRSIITVALGISVVIFAFTCKAASDELSIDPNVDTVSSGPFLWEDDQGGSRFRCVVLLSEVYHAIFIQKIEYGEENCCARVTKTYSIDNEKIEGADKLYSVDDIRWINHDSFHFVSNEIPYTMKNLDGTYECIKRTKPKPKQSIAK